MNQPIKKIRVGQVACAIWKNETVVNGKSVALLKTSVERRYKDSNGDWKSSSSFGRNELLLVVHCLQKAFDAVVELEQQENKESQ